MAKSAPLRIELDSDLDRRLSEVAEVMDQPKTALVEQAVRDFLEVRDWQDAAIDEGLRAAEEGRVFEHDEIVEWVASWDTPNERPMPTRDRRMRVVWTEPASAILPPLGRRAPKIAHCSGGSDPADRHGCRAT
jgi:predicted transcriptional regulator